MYPTLLPGESTHLDMQSTHPQKYICKYKKLAVKIAKSYNGMIYNLMTVLFTDGEMPNSFVWEIIYWQLY